MGLVTYDVPQIYEGVSQQPANLRSRGQLEEQVNMYSLPAQGVAKRPPIEYVAKITGLDPSSLLLHIIDRDSTERYIVALGSASIRVFDLNGVEQTVNTPIGTNYLTCTNPQQELVAVTVADYTFLVNKTVTPAMMPLGSDMNYPNDNYFDLRYPGQQPKTNWTLGISMSAHGTVQTFTDLPDGSNGQPAPSQGDLYVVQGDPSSSFTGYWVVYDGGVWKETVDPNIPNVIDSTTMPHALVREADGTFTFSAIAWQWRRYGDKSSNPDPSFIGRPIKDMFFHRNRLGFVAGENVIMSDAGDYSNFFRNTVTDLLDSDVIDVAVTHTKVSNLDYALAFDQGLMLFSEETQFQMSAQSIFTPTSVSIDPTTEYKISPLVRPIGVGPNAYFVSEFGDNSQIHEYYVNRNTKMDQAFDITSHCPRYVPSGIRRLEANTNLDVMFGLSDLEPTRLYVYKFLWTTQGKVQSCWSYWEHGAGFEFVDMATLDNYLYVIVKDTLDNSVLIEKINLQHQLQPATGLRIHLDDTVSGTCTYFSTGDYTQVVLPFEYDQSLIQLIDQNGNLIDTSTYTFSSAYEITLPGNVPVATAGHQYNSYIRLSQQYMRGRSNETITSGRLVLKTIGLDYAQTSFFEVSVAPYGSNANVVSVDPSKLATYQGRTLGDSVPLDSPPISSGTYRFMVAGDSRRADIRFMNSSHLPSIFTSFHVTAMFTTRGRIV